MLKKAPKLWIIISLLTAIILSYSALSSVIKDKEITVSANQPDWKDKLMKELLNVGTVEERKKILENNKEHINREFGEFVLQYCRRYNPKEFNLEKDGMMPLTQHRLKKTEIAVQVGEFMGDKVITAKALFLHAQSKSSFQSFWEEKKHNIPELDKAIVLFEQSGVRQWEALCHSEMFQYLKYDEPEKAIASIDKAIEISESIGFAQLLGHCYYDKGHFYSSNKNKNKALENYEKGFNLYKRHKDPIKAFSCLYCIINEYKRYGFFEEAFKYLEKEKYLINQFEIEKPEYTFKDDEICDFIGTLMNIKKEEGIKNYYYTKSDLYKCQGKYVEAITSYKELMELKLNIRKSLLPYKELSDIYLTIGQKDTALKYLMEAVTISEMSDSPEENSNSSNGNQDNAKHSYEIAGNLTWSYMNLGSFYLKTMKQPDKAMEYYQKALKTATNVRKGDVLINIRDYYKEKGEFEKELKTIEDIEEAQKLCNMVFTGSSYLAWKLKYIADVYKRKGEPDKAIEKLNEALKTNSPPGNLYLIYTELGEIYKLKGDKEKSEDLYKKAVEIVEKEKFESGYKILGEHYFNEGEWSKAEDFYFKRMKLLEEKNASPEELWKNYFILGQIYEKENKSDKACEFYKKSIETIENMRQELKIEEFKRDFMKDKIKVYEYMIDLLIKIGKGEEAFYYNEKSRSRAFLDILANQKINIRHGVRPELINKEEELATKIQYLSENIRKEKEKNGNEQKKELEENITSLKELKLEYGQLLQEIKMENPEYMSFISVSPFSLKETQSLIDKDTVIMEYFLGEKRGYIWIIEHNSFKTVIINETGKNIEQLVREYRELACENMTLDRLASEKWRHISNNLYGILFKDVEKYISNKKRIITSPHGILHYFPFQVLMDDKGKMLVEKYETAYIPSGSVLKYCKVKNTMKKDKLLAFEIGDCKIREFPPIGSTKEEINSIAQYFRENEIYGESNMKTEILLKKHRKGDIIHFATHGVLDGQSPLFSSLVFYDKNIYVYEIFNLKLKSYLVTLSACSTGLGENVTGDELIGLSRAFIYGGTPTVCVSLWNISDRATADLMDRFYYYLQSNNKSRALQLAQLDIMKKYKHPYLWSSFILIGDWR